MNTAQNMLNDQRSVELTQSLNETIKTLTEILHEETDLLRLGKVKDALKLETRKNETSHTYIQLLRVANENKLPLESGETPLHQELKETINGLALALEANFSALKSVREVSEELVETAADYVNSKIGGASTYTANGNMNVSRGKATKSLAMFKEI